MFVAFIAVVAHAFATPTMTLESTGDSLEEARQTLSTEMDGEQKDLKIELISCAGIRNDLVFDLSGFLRSQLDAIG